MHIHSHPMNFDTAIRTQGPSAAQQAADTRRRLAKAALSASEEADPFESFMIGHSPQDQPRRQRNPDDARNANTLPIEEEEPGGGTFSVSA